MSKRNLTRQLMETVKALSDKEALQGLCHQHHDETPLPSSKALEEIIELSRSVLFPGYFGNSSVNMSTIEYHIGVRIERLHKKLTEQIVAGLRFVEESECERQPSEKPERLRTKAGLIAARIIMRLPDIRKTLATDVEATYNGDPAAESIGEVISCYPAIKTLTIYRLAHELYLEKVPLLPRMMTEIAHSETGIDIHPAAKIGRHFTIDHGTGVVIGATCVIGDNVKIYQGVTLGAKSFPLDENGNPIKGIARHPIIGNNVVIYANATVLGRITIGNDCVVGANMWVTDDMKENTKIFKEEDPE